MNSTASLDQMQQLKLLGMHHAYHSQLELPMNQQLEGHELIAHLLGAEQLHRVNEKTTYYLKLAKLRLPATLEQIECSPARNLTKQQLATLAEGRYLDQGENLLITGATGCGKSFLACALGHQACIQGYKTSYLNMNRLIEKVTLSRLDGSYIKLLNHLSLQIGVTLHRQLRAEFNVLAAYQHFPRTRLQPFKQKNFGVTARAFVRHQPRRYHARIVKHQHIARAQKLRQMTKMFMRH